MRNVLIADDADADLRNAILWYKERSRRATDAFIDEVFAGYALIAQFPFAGRKVRGLVRQLPLARFPFVILYRPMKDHIIVLRVFHTSQEPRKKFSKRKT